MKKFLAKKRTKDKVKALGKVKTLLLTVLNLFVRP